MNIVRDVTITLVNCSSATLHNPVATTCSGTIATPPTTIAPGDVQVLLCTNSDSKSGPCGSIVYSLASSGSASTPESSLSRSSSSATVTIKYDHSQLDSSAAYSVDFLPTTVRIYTSVIGPSGRIAAHQQAVRITICDTAATTNNTQQQPVAPLSAWIGDLEDGSGAFATALPPGTIGTLTVADLCLPGMHDSCAYVLTDRPMPGAPKWLRYLKRLTGDAFIGVIHEWSRTQDPAGATDAAAAGDKLSSLSLSSSSSSSSSSLTSSLSSSLSSCDVADNVDVAAGVTAALHGGARYLDMRVCYDAATDSLRGVHSLFGPRIDPLLAAVAAFVNEADHAREVLLVDFNHFYAMTPALHARLQTLMSKLFSNRLVRKADYGLPLKELWRRRRTVHIVRSVSVVVCFLWCLYVMQLLSCGAISCSTNCGAVDVQCTSYVRAV
jgi:hypothetical protein